MSENMIAGLSVAAIIGVLGAFFMYYGRKYGLSPSFRNIRWWRTSRTHRKDAEMIEKFREGGPRFQQFAFSIGVAFLFVAPLVGWYLYSDLEKHDRARIHREVVAGSLDLQEGDPVPMRAVVFEVTDPSHDFEVDISPTSGKTRFVAKLHVSIVAPDDEVIYSAEHEFKPRSQGQKRGRRKTRESRRWDYASLSLKVNPTVPGTYNVLIQPLVVDIPEIYVNIYDWSL